LGIVSASCQILERNPLSGIVLNEFFEEDGDIFFEHAQA
jgi:hypothetical protein